MGDCILLHIGMHSPSVQGWPCLADADLLVSACYGHCAVLRHVVHEPS